MHYPSATAAAHDLISHARQLILCLMTDQKSVFAAMFNFVGGLAGLLSLALIVWNGGTLWQMVQQDHQRIDVIETGGSIGLREHVKEDNQRVADLAARLASQEDSNRRLLDVVNDIKGDVKVIKDNVADLKSRVNGATSKP